MSEETVKLCCLLAGALLGAFIGPRLARWIWG